MRVVFWTVIFEGDNIPVSLEVHATHAAARASIQQALVSFGRDTSELEKATDIDLTEAYAEATDGVCVLERHELDVTEIIKT